MKMTDTQPASERPRRRVALLGLLLVLAAGGGYAAWTTWGRPSSPAARQTSAPPKIPVGLATAETRDVPVYLTGLGTVQAFNTVTVRTRVDGELQKVAYTEGQDVKAGDLLAQIDPRPFQAALDQAIAKKAQDEAQLANAKLDLQRYTSLASQDFASRQQLDTQQARVAQFDAQIRGDQANIDSAKTQLDYTTIRAPLSGRTGIRLVDEGNVVHASDANGLVVITQLHPISVIFTLPEEQLPAVQAAIQAGPGPVPIWVMSRDGKRDLAVGTLALLDNQIDRSTGTIRLKGSFPNNNSTLWPGEFVSVRMLTQTLRQAVTMPAGAVQRGPNGFYAYVVKPDRTVEMRSLAVGQIADGTAVVESGLKAGEEIVVSGQYRLQPGSAVTARSEAPPAGQERAQQTSRDRT